MAKPLAGTTYQKYRARPTSATSRASIKRTVPPNTIGEKAGLEAWGATSSAVGESGRGAEDFAAGIALTAADAAPAASKIVPCSGLVIVNTCFPVRDRTHPNPLRKSKPQHSEQSSKIGYVN